MCYLFNSNSPEIVYISYSNPPEFTFDYNIMNNEYMWPIWWKWVTWCLFL